MLGQLRGFVRVARLGSRRPPEVLARVVAEHEEIVEALELRDEDAALDALVEHLHRSDYAIVEKPRKREKVRQ
jgi:DNA-binding GntR family transcriptional regulator